MRTIIISDVHGCCGALLSLLEKVKPESGSDRLVFLGDLFDRGADSRGVFLTVRQLAERFGDDFILLLGNHEDYLLSPKLTLFQRLVWERVGRQATVTSFQKAGEKMEDTIPWLKQHIRLYWASERYQCVHAGIRVEDPEINDHETLVHSHDIIPENRYAGKLTVTGHIALEKATWFAGDEETTEEPEEETRLQLPEKGALCIDTGCGKGGRLTAMVIDENVYMLYSVPEK